MNRTQVAKKHKIVTESGIEILIPVEDLDVSSLLEVSKDAEGFTQILIRKTGKITS